MGFIEETAVKAKDAFDVVAKKTNEVISVQKLKYNIANLNSQLSKEYETLGRLYFDTLDNAEEIAEEYKDVKLSIDNLKKQISELENELEKQTNVVNCKNCGGKNSSNNAYCSACGTKL